MQRTTQNEEPYSYITPIGKHILSTFKYNVFTRRPINVPDLGYQAQSCGYCKRDDSGQKSPKSRALLIRQEWPLFLVYKTAALFLC